MIIINISEWIVQLFVLGLAVIFWCIGLFFLALLIDVAKQMFCQQNKKRS
jgi:hypothetical protein